MSMMMILSVIVFLISIVGLVYTYVVMKNQKYLQSEMDTKLNERVQAHPYIRNPIFITYIFGFLAFLAMIAYVASLYY